MLVAGLVGGCLVGRLADWLRELGSSYEFRGGRVNGCFGGARDLASCGALRRDASCCGALRCVVLCCVALRCGGVCCSVLHCVVPWWVLVCCVAWCCGVLWWGGLCEIALRCAPICAPWKFKATEQPFKFGGQIMWHFWGASFEISDASHRCACMYTRVLTYVHTCGEHGHGRV